VAKGKIMSQMFTSLPSGASCGSATGTKAIAPTINQKALTIAIGAGAAYQDVLAALATGACAVDAGVIQNKGCAPVRLEIVYVNDPNCDANCDGCADGAALLPLTKVTKTFDVPSNTAVPVPAGLIAGLKVATLDVLGGALTANTVAQSVFWSSDFQASACGCTLVP
jgi:hypothetical protein